MTHSLFELAVVINKEKLETFNVVVVVEVFPTSNQCYPLATFSTTLRLCESCYTFKQFAPFQDAAILSLPESYITTSKRFLSNLFK